MTEEERDVLFEFVEYAKGDKRFYTIEDCEKRMFYNHKYGKNAAIRLLDEYFLDIITTEELTEIQFKKLITIVDKLDKNWIVSSDILQLNWDEIAVDRIGYVILKDGTRVDLDSDRFKNEREAFNRQKEERAKRRNPNK